MRKFRHLSVPSMATRLFIGTLTFTSLSVGVVAKAQNQIILLDVAGKKGGAIERLYSPTGRNSLATEIGQTLKAPGDSAFFILELPDYSKVNMVYAHVLPDGKWWLQEKFLGRVSNASTECQAPAMRTGGIDYRADRCYFESQQYMILLGSAGGREVKSATEFLKVTTEWIHLNNQLTTRDALIESVPMLARNLADYSGVIRTGKLYDFLRMIVLAEQGYAPNLSEPSGWMQVTPVLNANQTLTLAAAKKLQADGKIYVSRNVSCPGSVADRDSGDRILKRTPESEKCQAVTSMGESVLDIVDAMKAEGYVYDQQNARWN